MTQIKSRKHPSRLQMSTVLASLLLPAAAAHAADPQEKQMAEVVAEASKENDFKAERASSPKYTEKLVDTPQTITVIKKELFQQQNATTLTEALRNTPGVGTFFLGENGNTNTGDAIFLRGFDTSTSIHVDGVRDIGSISRDVFNIEQIDVLKGPAGTDTGRGAPTGSVNLQSKQANLENAVSGSLTGGSGSQKRATADVNRVLNTENGIAFRLNVMAQDSGSAARDVVKNKRWGVAPTIAFGLGGKTRAHLSYLHIKQDNVPDGGVPTIGLPGYTSPDSRNANPALRREFLNSAPMVDPEGFYGHVTDHDDVTADMATVRIDHDFSPNLRLQNTSRYGKTKQDYLLTSFMANATSTNASGVTTPSNLITPNPADPSTWLLKRTSRTFKDVENRIVANQTVLTWDVTAGGLQHTVVGGLEFIDEKQNTYSRTGGGVLTDTPLYAPNPGAPITGLAPVRTGAGAQGGTDTQALYLFDTVKIGEQWIVNGGVRVDHYNFDYVAISLANNVFVPTVLSDSDTLTTGKLSVLYKPTANSSVYATVASSKQPPGGATFSLSTAASSAANPVWDPQETVTKEIGTKWDLLEQKLAFTAALYRTDVKNEVEQDPTDANVYYQTGKKRVEGIELGVQGQITPNWMVSAGYTHMKTSVEAGRAVTASGEDALNYTPKNAFTSWTTYSFPFGLTIGGGVRHNGKLLRGTDGSVGTPAYAKGYWVADAMASYALTKNVDLRLNVYNLADEEYVASINKSGYRYIPGNPRSASLTANFRF
ncbi:catecholate siderophore receptor Fiu [Pseudoduganella albidiflava]|uniref:Catecholate siderophore receptor Fiu n=1 Tax=Pseudoduganella albidiflava TaxID=321983 RepID=A0A411WRQ3_9BURK|nr:catecholate siderophore receptor Fiu [Pseudoduganella albidiflava]QBH99432.1 catecholate siderophore receptor Fiu [Pseudoduganella albidiflava]GGY44805.1 catecholate siderophore receptor Fiu [Pseudoduganella albidiflava]